MKPVQVAVIGAGSISSCHLDSYRNNPNANLYAVCDLNGERAAKAAEAYGAARIYTDYRELLADPGVEAVSTADLQRVAADLFSNGSLAATVVGPSAPELPATRLDLS